MPDVRPFYPLYTPSQPKGYSGRPIIFRKEARLLRLAPLESEPVYRFQGGRLVVGSKGEYLTFFLANLLKK